MIRFLICIFITICQSLWSCNDKGELAIFDKTYTVEYVDDERNILGNGFTETRETKEIKAQNDSIAAEDAYIGFLAKLKVMYKFHEKGSSYISRPRFYYVYDANGNLIQRVKGDRREQLNNLVGKEVIEYYLT